MKRLCHLFLLIVGALAAQGDRDVLAGVESGPQVVDVLVSGSNPSLWAPAPFSLLSDPNIGAPLPWINIDTIQVVFDQDVDVEITSMTLTGINTPVYPFRADDPTDLIAPNLDGFRYNSATFTVTWILTAAIPTETIRINVDGETGDSAPVRAAGGGPLLNGSGVPGTDYEQIVDINHGNVNRDAATLVTDLVSVSLRIPSISPTPPYDQFHDVNADGAVSVTDLVVTSANIPSSAPGGIPADLAAAPVGRPIEQRRGLAAAPFTPVHDAFEKLGQESSHHSLVIRLVERFRLRTDPVARPIVPYLKNLVLNHTIARRRPSAWRSSTGFSNNEEIRPHFSD